MTADLSDLLIFKDPATNEMLKKVCKEHGIHPDAIAELAAWQRGRRQLRVSRTRNATFDEIFDNDDYFSKKQG